MEAVPAPRVIYRRPWTFTALPSVRRGRGAVVMILGLAAVIAAGARVLPPREGAFLGLLLLLPAALFLLRAFERPLVVLGRATMVVDAGGPGS